MSQSCPLTGTQRRRLKKQTGVKTGAGSQSVWSGNLMMVPIKARVLPSLALRWAGMFGRDRRPLWAETSESQESSRDLGDLTLCPSESQMIIGWSRMQSHSDLCCLRVITETAEYTIQQLITTAEEERLQTAHKLDYYWIIIKLDCTMQLCISNL